MLISLLGQKGLYFRAELLKYALFAQRTTSQSLRIRQTIQLPHAAPSTKKPPPKLVFLWLVIKTWVWMRASVSPGKITHTHSQRGGTNAVYSIRPQDLIGEKWFMLPDWLLCITDRWHVLHLSNSVVCCCMHGAYIHICMPPYTCVCVTEEKSLLLPPESLAIKERQEWVLAKPAHKQHSDRSRINKVAAFLRAISITGENCLCDCLRHVQYVHKSISTHGCFAQYTRHWGLRCSETSWFDLWTSDFICHMRLQRCLKQIP